MSNVASSLRRMANLLFWSTAIAFPVTACAVQPQHVLIDDFDRGEQNHFGGYRNTFERAPSRADMHRISEFHVGRRGFSLALQANRQAGGFCGAWIHFFNHKAPIPQFLDTSGFKYLSFWVRGHEGGEQFTVKLADQRWIEKEDAVAIGRIDDYLPDGVTQTWQEVIVPLEGDHGLVLERLGGLIIDFDVPGKFTIFVDNLALKSERKVRARPQRPVPKPPTPTIANGKFDRILWLPATEQLLNDGHRISDLCSFCRKQGVTQVWTQLEFDLRVKKQAGKVVAATCTIRNSDAVCRFVRAAHKYGIEIHASCGSPKHAQREWHFVPLAMVDAVLDHNRRAPTLDQVDGLQLDIQPQMLLGWHDPERREQVLFEFLTLATECRNRVRAASSRMKLGIDLPASWHMSDSRRGEAPGTVTFNGKRQPASYHALEVLDRVRILNYHDQSHGADGLIAHGRNVLERAQEVKHAKVYMGVQTTAAQPTDAVFVVGLSRARFRAALRGEANELARLSRLGEFPLRVLDDGNHVHVGVELAGTLVQADRAALARTLLQLASEFGVSKMALPAGEVGTIVDRFERSLRADDTWDKPRRTTIRDPQTGLRLPLLVATSIPQGKHTFADEDAATLATRLQEAEDFFGRFPSYAGIAVNDYPSYRNLLQARPR